MVRSGSMVWAGRVLALGVSLHTAGAMADAQAGHAADDTKPVAEVIVTGSHVRSVDLAPVVNVQSVDRSQIEQTGATQMAELISAVPSNTGTTLYNENGQLTGTAQFELRGLGFSSTLVLLNGRRAGVAPLSDKSGADFVDINQFPLSMVDRLEVLKDGSSAIYGSEAVAGVVNIITRKGFEGFELGGDYASSTNNAYSMNLASGHRFDNGSVSLYATYYRQTGNLRSNFPWLIERVGGNGVPGLSQLINNNGYPGTYMLAATNASGKPAVLSGAKSVPDPNCEAAGGVFAIGASGVPNTSICSDNFTDQIGVIPAQDRVQAFLELNYDLADSLSYFNETSASQNVNRTYEQVGSYSNGAAAGGLIYVPASAPFNFYVADPADPMNIIAVDPAQWNPAVNQAVALVGNFRPQGLHMSADKRQTNTYLRMVNGFDLTVGHDWQIEAAHQFAHAQYHEQNPLGVNSTVLNSLIASGEYNPFATSILTPDLLSPKDGVSVAANPQSVLDQIFYTTGVTRRTEQNVADLSASGPIFDLPIGTVSVAGGGQYREQTLHYTPDSLTAAGLATSPTTDSSFQGLERVWSEYLEAIVPIYQRVQFQAAVRHEDYGSGIGTTTDPKITGRFSVLPETLDLRASWGTSFQAPTLTQNATTQLIQILNDPVALGPGGLSCPGTSTVGTGSTVVTSGANLKPQSSENFDIGLDVKPLPALAFNVDYWHYNYTNLIAAAQNAQSILNGECVNGVYVPDPRVVRAANGIANVINNAYVNVGKVITDGLDLSASYQLATDHFGHFAFRADATHVNSFDVYGANGKVSQNAGSRNFNNNFAPMPKWRGNTRAVWSRSMHEIMLGLNYISSYKNDQDFNAPIDSFATVDLQYALHLDDLFGMTNSSTTLAVGANNLFDRDPPALERYTSAGVLVTGPKAVDRPGYDPLAGVNIQGRIVYARLAHQF